MIILTDGITIKMDHSMHSGMPGHDMPGHDMPGHEMPGMDNMCKMSVSVTSSHQGHQY